MIRIMSVQGDVLVEDRKLGYLQMARPGMTLPDRGDCLVVTNATSRAQIDCGSKVVQLGPLSYLRLRPDGRSWWDKHGLAPGGDTRVWIGRVWAKMGGPTADYNGPNAATGVRG
jgi:hypothetical protein